MKTLNTLLTSIAVMILVQIGFAQAPAIEWERCYGGTGREEAYSIKQTSDGGFIFAGFAVSDDGDVSGVHTFNGYNSQDLWVVKLSEIGEIQWQKCYGGSGTEQAWSIIQINTGGYLVVGISNSNDGDVSENYGGSDAWIIKLSTDGEMEWEKSYGGTLHDQVRSVQQTADDGYIMVGSSQSNDGTLVSNQGGWDFWILKLDSEGGLVWQNSLGGSNWDFGFCVRQTADFGYIAVGNTASDDGDIMGSHGEREGWVIKFDFQGNIEWQKCIGGLSHDGFSSVEQTDDGGYIIAGNTGSNDEHVVGNNGDLDFYVVKINSSGDVEWQKCYGGPYGESALSISLTTDGGYIVCGSTTSTSNGGDVTGHHGEYDYWVIKIDNSGNLEWQKSMGGSAIDWAFEIRQTMDGGIIVAGGSHSNDGDVTGFHQAVYSDAWIVKLSNTVGITGEDEQTSFSLYPNPAINNITISNIERGSAISIHDITGKLMYETVINNTQANINTSSLVSGVYFVQVRKGNMIATQKLVIGE